MSKQNLKRTRNYCFTKNNYNEDDLVAISGIKNLRYCCIGREVGEQGTPHLQGFLQFNSQTRLQTVINKMQKACGSAHITACNGTVRDNIKYCTKQDNNAFTYGEPLSQGERTDLEEIYDKIKEGDIKNEEQVMEHDFHTYCRYRNGIRSAINVHQKNRRKKFRDVKTSYLFGATGTGKTRHAVNKNDDTYVIHGTDLKWFDGYNGESCLVIDDYSNDVSVSRMLKLLDGYQCRLDIKGSFTWANWTEVIITSNLTPNQLHDRAKTEHRKALFRRIDEIWCVTPIAWQKIKKSNVNMEQQGMILMH